jgi:iron(II)-dependent oxidoreductase
MSAEPDQESNRATCREISWRELVALLTEARRRTLDLVADLTDSQLLGPRLDIVNPPLWEIGHLAWFQEKWALRHWRKRDPIRQDGDSLYDSAAVAHDLRWDLPLPTRAETVGYMETVLGEVIAGLAASDPGPEGTYFHLLALFHETMHAEALAYTRQTHGYPAPRMSAAPPPPGDEPSAWPGDVEVPGGSFLLGATADDSFVFDNEKWAHRVEVAPFVISRAPVTESEFQVFVDEGGYSRAHLWTPEGWRWREASRAEHPIYWRRTDDGWRRRVFDRWRPLEPHLPVLHVNAHEAEAYCRWAGRRLPTEAEWELAASAEPSADGRGLTGRRRRFPWGDELPTPERANLDWSRGGLLPVNALAAGDSAFGCRQMIGNLWEWTATPFAPYPGFVVDPYKEYSEPWFHDHRVLRGGCWATRSRLIRNTWRNFYQPHRRDVWCGFRTCLSK